MTWTTFFLLFAAAIVVWMILYLRGVFEPQICYRFDRRIALDSPNFLPMLVGFSKSIATQARLTQFWSQPDQIYAARLEAIQKAQHLIQFETFFMTPGYRADQFAQALIERSRCGVKVQVLVDHVGTAQIPASYWKQLRGAGVEVRFFHPPRLKVPLQYLSRTHRKLLIIDGTIALIGGMGVSDDWDGNPKIGDRAPWLDGEIQLESTIVSVLMSIFLRHWLYAGGQAMIEHLPVQQASRAAKPMLVIASDADSKLSLINALIWFGLQAAQHRIWIASPYFILERNTRNAIIAAKKRGVDVQIVTTGVHNDKPPVYYAVRERYHALLRADIAVYEYQPSMMHAKLMLVDQDWINFGSANFDPRSFFHNDELNLAWFAPDFAPTVEQFFTDAFSKSDRIELSSWRKRPWWQKMIGQLALLLRWQL
ncbi:cardiolipin synthetase [Leptolyngbya boryana NIES-2135]|jgi:cardiolipin synthase|uniref:Cardiolipin synthetase n=1 Tax=Leptolyngbya boryana NIES-2135 TaxID=1973484 RepID=A0A1Z4JK19_LEPBY|nr:MULTISPECIES: phospholipase D-like domain-containing protein [Leptolyngbya]BAY56927.1 cardiolipin synthetase [Leptolyngbya boryana NIES-2135]MBD2369005.1 cardiolipin synthase B [Leptolyngbya sp. FACHB-161]MBD2375787.1 cardiolipin synthase B [Leptolyngbya sp. FACHB-238]MBD2399901.1 cardiolipin synthase B [Leptolyngbya sp. FACHB-239]MBD2406107.1 cardiolipin synthase B [Leptolyngbya sp. FACHB-402]